MYPPMPALCTAPRAAGASVAAKSAWAGLAAGFLHTLCGPDHLAVSAKHCLTAAACQGSSRLTRLAGRDSRTNVAQFGITSSATASKGLSPVGYHFLVLQHAIEA
jgi:hydrogenase/urease accessory protein HupE